MCILLLIFADVAPEILAQSRHRKYTRAVDVWSLGVVLYICLCGFPPFSDELCTKEHPYTLAQQIKSGRFEYHSPYWDNIADPVLDLIDRMLAVDPEQRITIDECLEHPWLTGNLKNWPMSFTTSVDSTDGLTGRMGQLDFSKRKVKRERTLLSEINTIRVSKVIELPDAKGPSKVKVFEKNPAGKKHVTIAQENGGPGKGKQREEDPAGQRAAEEFMNMGGKGDMELFEEDDSSRYLREEVPR